MRGIWTGLGTLASFGGTLALMVTFSPSQLGIQPLLRHFLCYWQGPQALVFDGGIVPGLHQEFFCCFKEFGFRVISPLLPECRDPVKLRQGLLGDKENGSKAETKLCVCKE